MPRTFSFNILSEILKADYAKIRSKDIDNLICLIGAEGSGKSRLGLHIINIWFELSGIEKTEENFKLAMGVSVSEWGNILGYIGENEKHYSINNFDEAGDILSGKQANTKLVREMENCWKVIRGLNLFTIITAPSIFLLTPYIRDWRVRTVYRVKERGICYIYTGKTLKKLICENESSTYKDYDSVKPNFAFQFPDYAGVFLKPYLEMKNKKMNSVLQKFRITANAE
jgi:hypothetical protein